MFTLTLLLQTALLHSNKCLTRISDSLSQLCILQLNFQTHYVTSVSIFEAEIATDSLIISRDKLQKHSVLSSLCSHHSPQSLPQQFFFPSVWKLYTLLPISIMDYSVLLSTLLIPNYLLMIMFASLSYRSMLASLLKLALSCGWINILSGKITAGTVTKCRLAQPLRV